MPYRVDVTRGDDAVLDRLVELGALDIHAGGRGKHRASRARPRRIRFTACNTASQKRIPTEATS